MAVDIESVLEDVDDENPLKPVVEQLVDRVERVELARDAAHRRIDDLEEQIEEDKPRGEDDEDGSPDDGLLPIERLAQLKEDDRDEQENPFTDTTPSVDRAVAIFQHFREWSNKAPKGRVIRDNLKDLLNTATGERLAWKQVYRACRKLEEYSKSSIEFIQHDRHGWMLVAGQSSSVGSG